VIRNKKKGYINKAAVAKRTPWDYNLWGFIDIINTPGVRQ
jgi:hypothetical protein